MKLPIVVQTEKLADVAILIGRVDRQYVAVSNNGGWEIAFKGGFRQLRHLKKKIWQQEIVAKLRISWWRFRSIHKRVNAPAVFFILVFTSPLELILSKILEKWKIAARFARGIPPSGSLRQRRRQSPQKFLF